VEREIAKTLLRGNFDIEGDRAPVEAGCLIKVHPTTGSTRDRRIMRRLSQLLIELHGDSQRAD